MGIKKINRICPICNYESIVEEITSMVDEVFVNCDRCGAFSQKMIKIAIKDIEKVKKTYPDHDEDDKFITVRSGGHGTWKIIQEKNTHEGSFVDKEHIKNFLGNFNELYEVSDVLKISYNIQEDSGAWINISKTKKVD